MPRTNNVVFRSTHSVGVCVSVSCYLPAAQCGGYYPVHPWNVPTPSAGSTEAASLYLRQVEILSSAITRTAPLATARLTPRWSDGDQIYVTAHVSFGSLADICNACTLVCSPPIATAKADISWQSVGPAFERQMPGGYSFSQSIGYVGCYALGEGGGPLWAATRK